mmetsp:Transcript_68447/g.216623  ORF Transcript_68447/g.216623 Transcript_68447/m.216623 type:complete len:270 (-) Transcript_68447:36-845(-)
MGCGASAPDDGKAHPVRKTPSSVTERKQGQAISISNTNRDLSFLRNIFKGKGAGLDVDELCAALKIKKNSLAIRLHMAMCGGHGPDGEKKHSRRADKTVRLLEILDLISKITKDADDRAMFAFFLYDLNGDGVLDKRELEKMAYESLTNGSARGVRTSEDVHSLAIKYLAQVDKNNDQVVDWEEFQVLWRKFPHLFQAAFLLHETLASYSDSALEIFKSDFPEDAQSSGQVAAPWRRKSPTWQQKNQTLLKRSEQQYMSDIKTEDARGG